VIPGLEPINIAVLVSGEGRGTNLQAIIDGCSNHKIHGRVAVVIGVNDYAPAMKRARDQRIEAIAIDPKDYSPEDYEAVLISILRDFKVHLICLAGYMRKVSQPLIEEYRNKIMNVHPALIPMFFGKGMYGHHVHEAAIERGVKISGATVHFVDEDYDTGPIIIQKFVPVMFDDNPNTLADKVLSEEHRAYVEAVQLFAQNRLRVEGRKVKILEG
jgi:phosphoribosylglycinamide formyltransferase 1